MFKYLIVLFAASHAFAAESQTEIRIRPSRAVSISCFLSGQNTYTLQAASEAFKIIRVGAEIVKYEVYQDDFFVSSCDNIRVDGR